MWGKLRALYRFVGFTYLMSHYIIRYLVVSLFKGQDINRALRYRRQMTHDFYHLLGVKVEVQGDPPALPALLVCNHRSYFDPVVVLHDVLAWPVAKSEVANWPILGIGVKLSGILFVRRDDKDSRRQTRQKMVEIITAGHSILVYPEGTTHIRPTTRDFKMGSFVKAAAAGIPVVPMAIDYKNKTDAWVGDDVFVRHFFECFSKPNTYIKFCYGAPLLAQDPQTLMHLAKDWIDERMLSMQASW